MVPGDISENQSRREAVRVHREFYTLGLEAEDPGSVAHQDPRFLLRVCSWLVS